MGIEVLHYTRRSTKRWRPLIIGLAFPVVVLAMFFVVVSVGGFTMAELTEDPSTASFGALHPLASTGTAVALAGWAIGVGACLVGWLVTRQRLFAAIGLLTAGLWLDDAFQLHEYWLGSRLLGKGESFVMVAWGLTIIGVLYRQRAAIRRRRPELMAVALGLFGASLFFDRQRLAELFGNDGVNWFHHMDDICKMLAVYAWATWLVLAAVSSMAPTTTNERNT